MKKICSTCLFALCFLAPVQSVLAQPDPQDDKRFKELRKQLRSPDPQVAVEAARQLREISDLLSNTAVNLASALESRYPPVRAEAAEALAIIGPRASSAVIPLVRAIKKEKDDHALACMIKALGYITPGIGLKHYTGKALPAILPFTKHKNPDVRWKAASALGQFGEKAKTAVPALRKLLRDPTPPPLPGAASISWVAMESLQQIGAKDKETIDALFQMTKSKDLKKRRMAMVTLVRLAPTDERLLPLCFRSLKKNESLKLRSTATGCVARLVLQGADGKEAVPDLIQALTVYDVNNPNAAMMLRCAALRALTAIGPAAKKALPDIRRALSDPERQVRTEAKKVLERLENLKGN